MKKNKIIPSATGWYWMQNKTDSGVKWRVVYVQYNIDDRKNIANWLGHRFDEENLANWNEVEFKPLSPPGVGKVA